MLMWDGILVAYGEIAIKSSSIRRSYVRKLMKNITLGLRSEGLKCNVKHKWSRIIVDVDDIEKAMSVLSRIFGISYYSPYIYIELSKLEDFMFQNCDILLGDAKSFAVRVRRSGQHDFSSRDLEVKLGSIIKGKTGLKVSLESPDRTVYVEVRNNDCYIYLWRRDGLRGIPLGVSGRVVCLVSGGIDSPVAAWYMMKRGCPLTILHADINNPLKFKNFINIARRISYWHLGEDLHVYTYDHYKWLEHIHDKGEKYVCMLCKIMMYAVANKLAEKLGAWAIVTGESLGQVASQTSRNLMILDSYSNLPVIRPLISYDKEEIVSMAKKLGFYDYAIARDSSVSSSIDCWARPRRVTTMADPNVISKLLLELDFNYFLNECVTSIKPVDLNVSL
ncbi:MAG: tRNA 4-thiouridine(8) synthase ThiI [archaeon GBS-70-058]|nr:tRNA 4-thiouridine(8) synthase ThiI [Candidatus Culexarchaeum nevadense]